MSLLAQNNDEIGNINFSIEDSLESSNILDEVSFLGGFSVTGQLQHVLPRQLGKLTSINALIKQESPRYYSAEISNSVKEIPVKLSMFDYQNIAINDLIRKMSVENKLTASISQVIHEEVVHLFIPGLPIRNLDGVMENYSISNVTNSQGQKILAHYYYNQTISQSAPYFLSKELSRTDVTSEEIITFFLKNGYEKSVIPVTYQIIRVDSPK